MEIDLRRYRRTVAAFLVLILLYLIPLLPSLYGDYLWFVSLGYDGVFTKVILYKLGIFGVVSGVSFGVLYATYRVTVRNIRRVEEYEPSALVPAVLALVSLVLGLLYASSWRTVMEYLNGVDFGKVDPVYSLDVSFYVFELPFFNLVVGYLILVTVLSALVALALYTLTFGFEEYDDVIGDLEGTTVELEPEALVRRVSENGYGQMTVYIGVLLVLFGVNFYLSRYGLVFSTRGAVFGLGRTDFTVFKPLLSFLAVVSVGGGVACVANVSFRDNRVVYTAVGAVLIFAVVGNVAGIVYQSYVVEPDEYNKEKRFIENEIEFTRSAYALGVINETEFSVSRNLTRREIRSNPGTMNNIRLWDYRPLKTTYNQQQSLRTYYTFNDVDTDRYTIDGNETQVMLSAREVDVDQLSSGARSWVNTHLVYTHGFGVAMSPVSEVTSEGLPKYYIKDIPPKSSVDIEIEQPRIYYGESTDNYVISNSETKEFDYPSNDTNVYSSYSGAGGVELSSALREVVYSVKFGAPQILLSGSVDSDSRIQFNRDIKERVRRIAPFLKYDEDPYIAVADGRLKWIIDAYTTTSNYPYSKRKLFKGEPVNYVRNSVKVVIDAYSGEVNFYVSDEGPIIRTYEGIFPSLFKDFDEMPSSVRKHVRYPEDAFSVQSEMYLTYHMTNPRVFYNKEDVWRVPDEKTRGSTIDMEPYYIIMKIPGEEQPEFIQILPFSPRGKENMIGWLAARSDRPNYGELKSFLFSKQELIYGPMQIESRIDQDTDISKEITLLSQRGSSVIRGNLIVIPIADTVMYVEPFFLKSTGAGALPELKRVIVAQGDSLTMQPTLAESLDVLFGTGDGEPEDRLRRGVPGVNPERIQRLKEIYSQARDSLRRGDFAEYGDRIDRLGDVLNNVSVETNRVDNGSAATP